MILFPYTLSIRQLQVVTSFGQNFLDAINPITQRIHPTFNQMMDTGGYLAVQEEKGKEARQKMMTLQKRDEDRALPLHRQMIKVSISSSFQPQRRQGQHLCLKRVTCW